MSTAQNIIDAMAEIMEEFKASGLAVRRLDVEVDSHGELFEVTVRRDLKVAWRTPEEQVDFADPTEHVGYTVEVQPVPDPRKSASRSLPL